MTVMDITTTTSGVTADIEAKLAEVTAAGATVKQAPNDVGGGRLVATFADPDGNVLGLIQDR
jgi:predicted enzyme related to lactoylglutathione lyase